MKYSHLVILLLGTMTIPFLVIADDTRERQKTAEILFSAESSNYWTWQFVGEDISVDKRWLAFGLERYFVGDPIRGRLYISCGSKDIPLSRKDISEIPKCLFVEVHEWELESYPMQYPTSKPIRRASLSHLRLDDSYHLNIIHEGKSLFFDHEVSSEGLMSESFEILSLIGIELRPGNYLLKIATDENNCPYKIRYKKDRRWIRIFDTNTPQLMALKLCLEGRNIIGMPASASDD
ncbi:MAG: hypothetical protein ABIN58_00780, partial [candidate division WOR-3 bacterium]